MKIYIGKKCPYCNTEFTEDDEIVVCSSCEMPHHKDCWIDNKGCTTFGCTGTIQGLDLGTDYGISSAPKYDIRDEGGQYQQALCATCGTPIISGNAFCGKCGAAVQGNITMSAPSRTSAAVNMVSDVVSTGINTLANEFKTNSELDMELPEFIGTKAEYYMPVFGELKQQKKYTSWNWAAFLLSPFWCAYRKMYIPAGVIIAIDFILMLLGGLLGAILSIGMAVISGLLGNYLYMYDLEQRVAKGKHMSGPEKYNYTMKNGDINAIVPSVAAVIYVLICVLVKR